MTYTPTRPLMTSKELRKYRVTSHGRDYRYSDDGYEDVELAEGQGWKAVWNWGRDGWDLGDAPYVTFQISMSTRKFRLQQIVEGDHDVYDFDSQEDLYAAVDYLFLWYARSSWWAEEVGIKIDRDALDAGEVTVDDKFRGPCSLARMDEEKV